MNLSVIGLSAHCASSQTKKTHADFPRKSDNAFAICRVGLHRWFWVRWSSWDPKEQPTAWGWRRSGRAASLAALEQGPAAPFKNMYARRALKVLGVRGEASRNQEVAA